MIALLTALCADAHRAHADDQGHTDSKRATPDYDGRGNTDQEAGSWILWIPRVVLWPVWAVDEYVLRRPIGWFVRASERGHWFEEIKGLFTFGPGGNMFLAPTALFDFGLRANIGLYFAANNVGDPDNSIRAHVDTGGHDWLSVTALDRYSWDHNRNILSARAEFVRRPDYLFYGVGPTATEETRSRYGMQHFEAGPNYRRQLSRDVVAVADVGVRHVGYFESTGFSDPDLRDRVEAGMIDLPANFERPYTALFERAQLVIDQRHRDTQPGSGLFLRVHGNASADLDDRRAWIAYGGVIGAAVDVTGHQRNVRMQLGADFVDPLRGGDVPFDELAKVTGDMMPGFVTGWMNGRSTFTGQLGYEWPIGIGLGGETHLSFGNAFGDHLEGLTSNKFRLSADIGMTRVGPQDAGFQLLFGVGTETIEDGANITSVRLLFGSRRGF